MNSHNHNFYAQRYIAIIEVLKAAKLWDLEHGLYLITIIQYCMPVPSLHKIHQLLDDLARCSVNTDWAPYEMIKKLKSKLKSRINQLPEDHDLSENWGRNHPIAYGIHRITKLNDWPTIVKAQLVTEFVETIFLNMGAEDALDEANLYTDVYQLRDALIHQYAERHNLRTHIDTRKSLDTKLARAESITTLGERIGNIDSDRYLQPSFWDNPPHIPFSVKLDEIDASHHQHKPEGISQITVSDDRYLLSNSQQQDPLFSERSQWMLNNLSSMADSSQLSWHTIFCYWNFLLEKKKRDLFVLSVLSLTTGLSKKRWINGLINTASSIDTVHLNEKNQFLIYKIDSGTSDFLKTDSYQIIQLSLPIQLNLSQKTIANGIKEESALRAFNAIYPGISPALNNVARSGHTLLRKHHHGELKAYLLSGKVPIEFKARSAYLQTTNADLNGIFLKNLKGLAEFAEQYLDKMPFLKNELCKLSSSQFKTQPIQKPIGSQLGTPNWNLSTFAVSTITVSAYRNTDVDQLVEIANHMELYYFWLMQYSSAARAAGDNTQSHRLGEWLLHKDKASADYLESKVIKLPNLVDSQFQEVWRCRQHLIKTLEDRGYKHIHTGHHTQHSTFTLKPGKRLIEEALRSKEALVLSQRLWNMQPLLNRNNAHRHQCATFIHHDKGEIFSDTWLGHHIDGWYHSAPESGCTIRIIDEVLKSQTAFLDLLGFKLVRNPLV